MVRNKLEDVGRNIQFSEMIKVCLHKKDNPQTSITDYN